MLPTYKNLLHVRQVYQIAQVIQWTSPDIVPMETTVI